MSSLKKAFDIIDLFINLPGRDLHLSEIAKLSGLKMATANRIAATLVDLGYLDQKEKRGKYSIGKKLIHIDSILLVKYIQNLARPYLQQLNELTGETVALATSDGRKAFIIESFVSKQLLNVHSDPSISIPLYCSGTGKIFLADMSEPELEEYFKNTDIKAYTRNTITDLNLIKRDLLIVAQEGVAYDDEELLIGVRNVSAGIKDSNGKTVCCIGVIGPTVRLTSAKLAEIAPELKQCASEINRKLELNSIVA